MAAALALLASLVCAAAPAGLVGGEVRTEARVRASGAGDPALDLEVDPRVELRLAWPAADLSVAYAPRLAFPTSGPTLLRLLHQGSLALSGRTEGDLRLSLSERASHGEVDLSPVAFSQAGADPAVPIQPVPGGLITVRLVTSQTDAALDVPLHRHAWLSLSAGWRVDGGADAEAQRALPLQRGPLADLAVSIVASRVDLLRTRLSGSSMLFTTGLRTTVAGLEEQWNRALSSTLALRLAAGLAATDVRGGGAASVSFAGTAWHPLGEAGLAYDPGAGTGRFQAALSVRASPVVDRLTAEAYERVDARLSAAWAPRRELRLTAQAAAGVVASGAQRGGTLAAAEAAAAWDSGAEWTVALGVRAAHQVTPTPLADVAVFLAVAALGRERF